MHSSFDAEICKPVEARVARMDRKMYASGLLEAIITEAIPNAACRGPALSFRARGGSAPHADALFRTCSIEKKMKGFPSQHLSGSLTF